MTNPFDPKPMPQNPLRLRERAPSFVRSHGDVVRMTFDAAISEAHRLAEIEQRRYVVTGARLAHNHFRVQAWR